MTPETAPTSGPPGPPPQRPPQSEPPPALPPGPRRALPAWMPLLVVAVAWVAHGAALSGGWVGDDVAALTGDPSGAVAFTTARALKPGAWAATDEPGAWRPLAAVSLAVQARLTARDDGRLSPFGFRLVNLFLHGLAAWLLLALLWRLRPDRAVFGAGTALLYATHPAFAATVGSIAGRAELLALVFSLLALRAVVAAASGSAAAAPWAGLAWLLALLSHESAVGLPAVAIVAVAARRRLLPERVPWMRVAAAVAPWAIALGAWLLLRPGAALRGEALASHDLGRRAMEGLRALGLAAVRLALPAGLGPEQVVEAPGALSPMTQGGRVLALLAFGAVSVAGARALLGRAGRASASWLAAGGAAVLAAFALPWASLLEGRTLLLPAVALLPIAGLVVEALFRTPGPRWVPVAATAAAVLATCCLSLSQAEARRDEATLHAELLRRDPTSVTAMVRMARSHRLAAEAAREASGKLRANDPERDRLLAEFQRSLERGLAWAARAVQQPEGMSDPSAHAELGRLYLLKSNPRLAEESLERWQQLEVQDLDALSGPRRRAIAERFDALAQAEEAQSKEEAAVHHDRAARLRDDSRPYAERAAAAKARVNLFGDAIEWYERALRIAEDAETAKRLAGSLEETRRVAREFANRVERQAETAEEAGDDRAARDAYMAVIAADPTRVRPYYELARIVGPRLGDFGRARRVLDAAERLLVENPSGTGDWMQRIRALRRIIDEKEKAAIEEESKPPR